MKKIFLSLASIVFIAAATSSGYEVGDIISDFTLKNTDGKMVSLSDYKKEKGVILIFDCNTCPYSQAYNSRIIALNEKYASKGFPVVTINSNDPEKSPGDSFQEMSQYAKTNKYTFAYLFDESQKVAKDFGATNTPHVFVLSKTENEFKVAYIGAIDNNVKDTSSVTEKYVETAVDALLSGRTFSTTKTKAIGCTIKWKD
jgi:peroxiredoxin